MLLCMSEDCTVESGAAVGLCVCVQSHEVFQCYLTSLLHITDPSSFHVGAFAPAFCQVHIAPISTPILLLADHVPYVPREYDIKEKISFSVRLTFS